MKQLNLMKPKKKQTRLSRRKINRNEKIKLKIERRNSRKRKNDRLPKWVGAEGVRAGVTCICTAYQESSVEAVACVLTYILAFALLGCLVAWLLGYLVAWLLGCLVAWLLGHLVAWLLGC